MIDPPLADERRACREEVYLSVADPTLARGLAAELDRRELAVRVCDHATIVEHVEVCRSCVYVLDDLEFAERLTTGEPRLIATEGSALAVAYWARGDSVARMFCFGLDELSHLFDRVHDMMRVAVASLETALLGRSPAMRAVRREVQSVALFGEVAVMLLGESGTGKELVARALHEMTIREPAGFIAVNCAAVPTTLFESTLFGHERGAFTGATSPRPGLFEEARDGTLFLDEVVDMPHASQGKLLRALEQRVYRRVGADTELPFTARIVSATNKDPQTPSFRADLFHRMAGFTITIPPLRARAEDVLDLAPAFAHRFCDRHGLAEHDLEPAAMNELQRYEWPGNVRELKAVVEHLIVVSVAPLISPELVRETLELRAFAPTITAVGTKPIRSLGLFERDLIVRTLDENSGNVSKTARDLGLPRSTLRARLRRYRAEADEAE